VAMTKTTQAVPMVDHALMMTFLFMASVGKRASTLSSWGWKGVGCSPSAAQMLG
jgi:hypothetical protein